MRPLALLFVAYRVAAPIYYLLHRLRTGKRFDLVQMVESNLGFGDVSYAHFCHTAFLKEHWRQTQGKGLRRLLRWLDHKLHSLAEKAAFRRARKIVVPSRGLSRELIREFPFSLNKIVVLPNAVDVERLQPEPGFDRDSFRRDLGLLPGDTAFLFMALGQFERKGLPLLLDGLVNVPSAETKLVVVGGEPDLIEAYKARVEQLGLADRVIFAGMQEDVRPFFWAADAFAFPSLYETFSLVTYEAAAAGLPILAPPLNGVEDLIRDGENGIVLTRTVEGIRCALQRFLRLTERERAEMGRKAKSAAAGYNQARFSQRWRMLYQELSSEAIRAVQSQAL
jgi:glycosyltransferase involved in cell wall biosynthesis